MLEESSYRTTDRVVTLRRRRPSAAKTPDKGPAAAAGPEAAVEPEADVRLRLWAVAASGRWHLKLWKADGRDPSEPVPAKDLAFAHGFEKLVPLTERELDGRTLTWVLRLQSNEPSPYDVRMTLYQGGDPVPGGDFAYSGTLDGTEEIGGRFHFRQEAAPEPPTR